MDLLIRQKSKPCAKTSLKAAVVPAAAVCKAEAKRVPVDSAVGSAPEVKVAGRLPEAEKGGRVVLVEDFPNPDNLGYFRQWRVTAFCRRNLFRLEFSLRLRGSVAYSRA